jgi:hypothetical protein
MKHIGGFFELEPESAGSGPLHSEALLLQNGRACLVTMLQARSPRRAFVPHYTCDATLDPFRLLGVELVFYGLDPSFLPEQMPALRQDDVFLYTNHFGLCESHVETLTRQIGPQLVVDDTHALFRGARAGLWSFTSARKYFGVPDGAFLFSPEAAPEPLAPFEAYSLDHLRLRSEGLQREAFAAYQAYERTLDCRVFGISHYSRDRLSRIDFQAVAARRRRNFLHLDAQLGHLNRLSWSLGDSVPFCYPLLPTRQVAHEAFYAQGIYPPRLWPDVLRRDAPATERTWAAELLPLPVDHRYDDDDMDRIVRVLAHGSA